MALVIGYRRVPDPPAKIIPFTSYRVQLLLLLVNTKVINSKSKIYKLRYLFNKLVSICLSISQAKLIFAISFLPIHIALEFSD